MKYQAVREGQFIGAPQATPEAAEAVIAEDRAHTVACYNQGWIMAFQPYADGEEYAERACRWWIRTVR